MLLPENRIEFDGGVVDIDEATQVNVHDPAERVRLERAGVTLDDRRVPLVEWLKARPEYGDEFVIDPTARPRSNVVVTDGPRSADGSARRADQPSAPLTARV